MSEGPLTNCFGGQRSSAVVVEAAIISEVSKGSWKLLIPCPPPLFPHAYVLRCSDFFRQSKILQPLTQSTELMPPVSSNAVSNVLSLPSQWDSCDHPFFTAANKWAPACLVISYALTKHCNWDETTILPSPKCLPKPAFHRREIQLASDIATF